MCCNCDPTARYHEEEQTYILPSGEVPEGTLNNAAWFLRSLKHAPAIPPIPLVDWTKFFESHPTFANFVDAGHRGYNFDPYLHFDPCRGTMAWQEWDSTPILLNGTTPEQRRKNAITHTKKVHRWHHDRINNPLPSNVDITELMSIIGNQWIVSGSGENVGTWPKRLAKHLWKAHAYRLSPQRLETIGNMVSAGVSKQSEYTLTFDQDFVDGNAEDYCNDDSCWWKGERTGVREAFAEEGGYAIRQWNGKVVKSRSFIIWNAPHKCYILFNAYGELSLAETARLLSLKWGMSYVRVKAVNQGGHAGKVYINNSVGYAICVASVAAALEEIASIDLNIEEPHNGPPCCCCGDELDEDDCCTNNDGDVYCDGCYNEQYTSCSHCGEEHPADDNDLHDCNGDWLCDHCADGRGYQECATCSDWIDSVEYTPDGECCNACCERFVRCDECDRLKEPRDMTTTADGDCHCSDCYVEPEEEEDTEEVTEAPTAV